MFYRSTLIAALAVGSSVANAFPGLDDQTVGIQTLRANRGRSAFSSEAAAAYYDGNITTSPPDSVHTDKRLESFLRLGWDQPYNQGMLRFQVEGNSVLRTEEDSLEPKIYIDERVVTARATADGTFLLQNGFEILVGVQGAVFPGYTRITSTANGKSKRSYEAATLVNPRAGFGKRTGDWGAGFYYSAGAERTKSYKEQVFDGTALNGSETVAQPSRIGFYGASPVGAVKVDGEFALIQGGNFGPTDAGGRNTNDNSYAMQVAGEFTLFGGMHGRVGAYHQTLSYSDQAFMSLDNIPSNALRLETFIQQGNFHGTAGLVYGFGKDTQSVPEFSADYSYRAVGAVGSVEVFF